MKTQHVLTTELNWNGHTFPVGTTVTQIDEPRDGYFFGTVETRERQYLVSVHESNVTPVKETPTDRRINAVSALVAKYTNNWQTVKDGVDRAQVSDAICELQTLGRTQRWHDAIATWSTLVVTHGSDDLCWAITQGAINTCHAA